MTRDHQKKIDILVEEIAEQVPNLFDGVDRDQLLKALKDPANEGALEALREQVIRAGKDIVERNKVGQDMSEEPHAEAVGIGAFRTMLSGAVSSLSLRATLLRAAVWWGGASVVLLLGFFLIRGLIPYFVDQLTDQAPKLRNTAPEMYCAMTYRIDKYTRYPFCEDANLGVTKP